MEVEKYYNQYSGKNISIIEDNGVRSNRKINR